MPFAAANGVRRPSYHLAVVMLPEGGDRDAIRATLSDARIQTSVHYPPIHTFTAYRPLDTRPLPRTDEIAGRIVTLPLFPALREADVETVATSLRAAVTAARA